MHTLNLKMLFNNFSFLEVNYTEYFTNHGPCSPHFQEDFHHIHRRLKSDIRDFKIEYTNHVLNFFRFVVLLKECFVESKFLIFFK